MPALDQSVIADLTGRLVKRLGILGIGDPPPKFINAGASAAVFRVETAKGPRAFKVFDPKFLEGDGGPAERKRLDLQRKLVGHSCPYLVTLYNTEEAEGTAFVEMEFCPWPQLSGCLSAVPDDEVPSLISQLVAVVRFLEERNIIHRDIKPENIHISPDFKALKVLDLGVARLFEADESDGAAITDRQHLRPFVATAQYSSPEYLFRLDEPTPRLW
ncbi:MAG: protein kinase domain-containing protein [Limisphaerales bacterium]